MTKTYGLSIPELMRVSSASAMVSPEVVANTGNMVSILGTSTVVAGLVAAPTDPATMNITIGVGTIFSMDEIDATAYGDLGTNTNSVMKMGINQTPQTLTITAPSTGGYSQVYLVQVIIQDIDSGATVLSYYNSSNPSQPYSGPANAGTSNFTTRLCQCTIALKAGVAAPTGSEVTPSPDAGYTGLYTITVVDGQSSITGADIVQLASAPFFPTLPAIPLDVLNGTFVYAGQDTGAANAYVITFGVGQPQPTQYTKGMGVKFTAANTNTGTSTINVDGLGAVTIHRANGVALAANDITAGQAGRFDCVWFVDLPNESEAAASQPECGVMAGSVNSATSPRS